MRAITIGVVTATAVATLGLLATPARAADHFDGVETSCGGPVSDDAELGGGDGQCDPSGDIADFYSFPNSQGRLVLILNTFPRAGKQAMFSDVIEYGFRLRPADVVKITGGVAPEIGSDEYTLFCRFSATGPNGPRGRCVLSKNGTELTATEFDIDDKSGGGNSSLKVFAGLRSDPFFTDAIRMRMPRPRFQRALFGTGNSMQADRTAVGIFAGGHGATKFQLPNVLSIVAEIDLAAMMPEAGSRFAIVAETNKLSRRP